MSPAKPQALSHPITSAVLEHSSKSKKYTKEDIQEMLGRHTLDNEVVFIMLLYFVYFFYGFCNIKVKLFAVLYFNLIKKRVAAKLGILKKPGTPEN